MLFDSKAWVMLEWEGGATLSFPEKLQVSAREGRPQERSEDGVYGVLLEQNRERPKALSRLRSLRAKKLADRCDPVIKLS